MPREQRRAEALLAGQRLDLAGVRARFEDQGVLDEGDRLAVTLLVVVLLASVVDLLFDLVKFGQFPCW